MDWFAVQTQGWSKGPQPRTTSKSGKKNNSRKSEDLRSILIF